MHHQDLAGRESDKAERGKRQKECVAPCAVFPPQAKVNGAEQQAAKLADQDERRQKLNTHKPLGLRQERSQQIAD